MSCERNFFPRLLMIIGITVVLALFPNTILAGIVSTGDVEPDVAYWDEWTDGVVGHESDGTVTVDNGSVLTSCCGYLGGLYDLMYGGGAGTVTITGSGSAWNSDSVYLGFTAPGHGTINIQNAGALNVAGEVAVGFDFSTTGVLTVDGVDSQLNTKTLRVGYYGQGTLSILNGSQVVATGKTQIAVDSGASGTISFGTNGGTLTTASLLAATSQLTGTGTINTKGLVSDINLAFNSAGDLSQSIAINQSGRDITLNLDISDSNTARDLGVGYAGAGTMMINGTTVYSPTGYLGYKSGSSGTATVNGTASTWNSTSLYVGYSGQGTLDIVNGGSVNTESASIGSFNSNISIATVDGSGSTWTNNGALAIGHAGWGVLNITNGALVSNDIAYLGNSSGGAGTVTVAGANSTWSVGSDLYVGNYGDGQLNIATGGSVSVAGTTYVGNSQYSLASLNLSGGTLDTQSLFASGLYDTVTGTGTVNTRGLVSDVSITFDGLDSSHGLNQTVAIGQVDVNLNMSDSTNVAELGVGYWDSSTLVIRNGIHVHSATGYLGLQPGSSGVATVEGSNSEWSTTSDLHIGIEGDGTLNIQNGAVVTVADTTYVGSTETSSYGIVAFAGTGGTLSTKNLEIQPSRSQFTGAGVINAHGVGGNVSLTFDNSSETSMTLGSAVTLNVNAGDSNNAGDLGIGYSSSGSLVIQNGATVYTESAYMAHEDGSSATATVDGADTTWVNNGMIYVGGFGNEPVGGTATLNITGGATVSTLGITQGSSFNMMGSWYGPVGIVNIDGGTLQAKASTTQFLSRLYQVAIMAGGATIDTNGHDITTYQAISTHDTSTGGGLTKTGEGTLKLVGANTYTGLTTVEAGVLELDANAQTVVLSGGGANIKNGKIVFDYIQNMMSFEAPDVLTPLAASYTGGTAPWTTGQFQSSTADGTYGLGWIDDGSSTVTVMYTLYGDSNLDGSVNGTDLNAVLSYYNQSGEVWNHGDFNYDGSVNGTDLNTVLSNYNQSLSSSTAAVPEPSTWLLMVMGLAGLLAWRKRK